MLTTKLLLCATMLILGDAETKETNPPAPVEQAAVEQAAQTEQVEQKVEPQQEEEKKAVPPDSAKLATAPDATDAEQSDASEEPEEQVVDGVKLQAIEAHVVSYTNQERARHGLPPLKVDPELMKTAREHAAWMTRNRSMVHTWRAVAENIAMGQPHSRDVVRAWMNSSGHRANILNSGHGRIGVAAFRTDGGTIFWCQQFLR